MSLLNSCLNRAVKLGFNTEQTRFTNRKIMTALTDTTLSFLKTVKNPSLKDTT